MNYATICKNIDSANNTGCSRSLYKDVAKLKTPFAPKAGILISKDGQDITDKDKIKQRWQEYTEKLYEKTGTEELDIPETISKEPDILISEVHQALKELSMNKSPGHDNIPCEFWKHLDDDEIVVLHKLCNKIWSTCTWPTDWKRSIYVTLFKKGNPKHCENYRTIALISHTSKVLLKIIQKRLNAFSESQLPLEQAGFRKKRGTRDHIANLRWILEIAKERNNNVFLCFIDYSKAFDCVDHNTLWNVLHKMGAPPHLIHLMKNLYLDQEAKIKTEDGDTEWFGIGKGVRQGCILSPMLFNIYGENIMRAAVGDSNAGVRLGSRKINNLRYADDTTLVASTAEELGELIQSVKRESEKVGLYLNINKTKIMSNTTMDEFTVRGERLEIVHQFKFLGSLINTQSSCKEEIRCRTTLGRAAMNGLKHIWKDRDINTQLKTKLVKTLVFPIITYASETWTTTLETQRNIQACELWCWRRMLRISWTDRISNATILQTVGNPIPLNGLILKQKLSYFGHIMRTKGECLERDLMLSMMEGTRSRGRPRKRWLDEIKSSTMLNLEALKKATQDRSAWRSCSWLVAKSRPRLGGTR